MKNKDTKTFVLENFGGFVDSTMACWHLNGSVMDPPNKLIMTHPYLSRDWSGTGQGERVGLTPSLSVQERGGISDSLRVPLYDRSISLWNRSPKRTLVRSVSGELVALHDKSGYESLFGVFLEDSVSHWKEEINHTVLSLYQWKWWVPFQCV